MSLLRELRLELSAMIFITGIILTIFIVDRYAIGTNNLPDLLRNIDLGIGAWMVWLLVIGPILLLGGGWYFIDTIRKRREFERLIDTDSKAKFVRNQDRIEQLAWILGTGYGKRVQTKKVEFGIR